MPLFFPTPQHFRRWLQKHHATERELVVAFYRKDCDKPSITWPESVEEALCFGWIDGIRRKLDADSYTIRFTPRRSSSIWSQKNLATMARLIEEGRVAPAGLKIYESRDQKKTALYSFERTDAKLPLADEKLFRSNAKAWSFWQSQVPSYRKPATWWVISAKQDATRRRRLETLITCSAKGLKIPHLRRPTDKQP
jgi:uncharacterized protein YdeI (YjbR/CyaY-like superfamily)